MGSQQGLGGRSLVQIGDVLANLCRAFLDCDAVVAEINPMIEDPQEGFIGLDAHVEIEDDALYRQEARLAPLGRLVSTAHGREPTVLEREAQRIDQMDHRGVAGRVVEFDGDLALLIGGGGASLTVFDAVRKYGGHPANYCEIGGNPTEEKVAALTALLLAKPGVRRLAVIMNVVNNTRADVIARGVLDGLRLANRDPALTISVFRIPGSWEKEAADIMAGAGVVAMGRECSLDQAARTAVEEARSYVA
jgi:succinyl-CoA synthetase beta subunit/citryl-CoA synthetase large subunit